MATASLVAAWIAAVVSLAGGMPPEPVVAERPVSPETSTCGCRTEASEDIDLRPTPDPIGAGAAVFATKSGYQMPTLDKVLGKGPDPPCKRGDVPYAPACVGPDGKLLCFACYDPDSCTFPCNSDNDKEKEACFTCGSDVNGKPNACGAPITTAEQLQACQNRKQTGGYKPESNGCGGPWLDQVFDLLRLVGLTPPEDRNNPWGGEKGFKDCCDPHDGCYGTCESDRTACDRLRPRVPRVHDGDL